jgi:hypothetical protein
MMYLIQKEKKDLLRGKEGTGGTKKDVSKIYPSTLKMSGLGRWQVRVGCEANRQRQSLQPRGQRSVFTAF